MAENGQPTNSGEASSEDEILVIPAGTQGSTTGSGRVATSTSTEPDPNEIPDPPPEDD